MIRYNPALRAAGKKPFVLDSPRPRIKLEQYAYNEMRYKVLTMTHPEAAQRLMQSAQELVELRWQTYEHMADQEPARYQPAGGEPKVEKAAVPPELMESWLET